MSIGNDPLPGPEGLDDEVAALDHAVERLSERFPTVSRDHIKELVDEHHHRFEGAPVRDFVPVLIEHDVKVELRIETGAVQTS